MPQNAITGVRGKDRQDHLVRRELNFWEGGSSAARAGLQNSRGLVMRLWGSLASSPRSKRLIPSSGLLSLLARRGSRRAIVLPQYRAADETTMWDVMPANSNMIIPWLWQNCLPTSLPVHVLTNQE